MCRNSDHFTLKWHRKGQTINVMSARLNKIIHFTSLPTVELVHEDGIDTTTKKISTFNIKKWTNRPNLLHLFIISLKSLNVFLNEFLTLTHFLIFLVCVIFTFNLIRIFTFWLKYYSQNICLFVYYWFSTKFFILII